MNDAPAMKPEHWRHYAAGHINAARAAVEVVQGVMNEPIIVAPPAVMEVFARCIDDLGRLERWFIHPLNATIEGS
jgi:hypothetical protein